MSHSPAAQDGHGTGSGRRTMPTTRSPRLKPEFTGASSTVPSDSWPITSRLRPGGAQPYRPATISRSVPHTPKAKARTRTAPSETGGSGTSSMPAELAIPGATVRARIMQSHKFAQTALLLRAAAPARPAMKRLLRNKVPVAELGRHVRRYNKSGSNHANKHPNRDGRQNDYARTNALGHR